MDISKDVGTMPVRKKSWGYFKFANHVCVSNSEIFIYTSILIIISYFYVA